MKLSGREKFALLVLAVVAILALGGKFLVMPAIQEYNGNRASLRSAAQAVRTAQSQLADASALSAQEQKTLQKAESAAGELFPSLEDDLLNVWVQKLALQSGVTLEIVRFENIGTADTATGKIAAGGTNYALGQYAAAYTAGASSSVSQAGGASSSSSSSVSSSSGAGEVLAREVSVQLTAPGQKQLSDFLDALGSCGKAVACTSLNVDTQTSPGSLTATGKLTFYAAAKLSSGDSTLEWAQWGIAAPSGKSSLVTP